MHGLAAKAEPTTETAPSTAPVATSVSTSPEVELPRMAAPVEAGWPADEGREGADGHRPEAATAGGGDHHGGRHRRHQLRGGGGESPVGRCKGIQRRHRPVVIVRQLGQLGAADAAQAHLVVVDAETGGVLVHRRPGPAQVSVVALEPWCARPRVAPPAGSA
jgi:hypothetical protein